MTHSCSLVKGDVQKSVLSEWTRFIWCTSSRWSRICDLPHKGRGYRIMLRFKMGNVTPFGRMRISVQPPPSRRSKVTKSYGLAEAAGPFTR